MDAIQGAVLGIKLGHLDAWTSARRRAAEQYTTRLADFGVGLPMPCDGDDHVWHVYAIRVRERERVRRALADAGIATGMHYPVAVHMQPAYADLGYAAGAFPVSERLAAETLSLPLFPELTENQIERVCAALARVCAGEDRVRAA
jgi:dTDP-4-amino-4,6-dideoxygalactose transaminase